MYMGNADGACFAMGPVAREVSSRGGKGTRKEVVINEYLE